ncbi:MAG TPA: T9SS type A sorting domain-containing protein, partial [Bacteroidetes bacterium]|nr:T9SS type A sorting domain-containing protein [Bacteroidota bacterium]
GKLKIYFNNQGVLEDEPSFVSYDYYTFSCAMGDADGDGDLDIATTGGEPYQSLDDYGKIFYNNNGTFSNLPQWTSSFKFSSLDVDFGDLDQNGKLDIAFANEAYPNYLYTADDLGEISNIPAWQSAENTNYMNSLDMGCIGQDQTMGIVFTGNNQLGGDGKVKLYTFSDEIPSESDAVWSSTVSGYWSGVLLHDVDLDGINDLIYGGWWLPVNIHLGNSDNFDTLSSYTSLTSSVVEAIQVADLDKDGMQDTLESFVVDERDNSVFWLKYPVEFINSVVVTDFGIGSGYYCYVPGKNWLSVDKEIVANGDTVYISYQYSNKGDIVISNWDSSIGNYIFYNDTTLTTISDHRKKEFDFRVYPNPAHNEAFVNFRQMGKSNVTISLCDLNGRPVRKSYNRNLPAGKHSVALNVNGLPEGLYLVKLTQGGFTKTKKIIIQ